VVAGEARRIAGGDGVAVAQVEWLDPDTLVYSSDENGWWNLYTARWDGTEARLAVSGEEEFGGAAWQPGQRWFAVLPGGRRVAAVHGRTVKSVSVYDLFDAEYVRAVGSPHTAWFSTLTACGNRVAAQAGGPATPYEIVAFDARGDAKKDAIAVEVIAPGTDPFGAAWVPESSVVTFRAADEREIHANLYAPTNPDYAGGAPGEKPPYVVFVHGGPTGSSSLAYDLEVAYFTSRGIGVVDVNYGGSIGYGRAYRERLRGQWGVVDVDDCAAVVAALVEQGIADGARIAIRGGSAGGWTSAAALAADPEGRIYRCGAIRFPVLDPVAWRAGGTHDLESRYLDGLIGPWPQAAARYREVSPLEGADRISVPFVLLQGMQDAVCPPAQTRVFLDRIKGGQVPFGYLAFEGEEHGFRRASTIATALEAELSLYGQAMGFDPSGVQRLELGS
jgi:dipeptidyl aminopeptidase/acylaminoacyl peptidase